MGRRGGWEEEEGGVSVIGRGGGTGENPQGAQDYNVLGENYG